MSTESTETVATPSPAIVERRLIEPAVSGIVMPDVMRRRIADLTRDRARKLDEGRALVADLIDEFGPVTEAERAWVREVWPL